jgi:hypothetical protein
MVVSVKPDGAEPFQDLPSRGPAVVEPEQFAQDGVVGILRKQIALVNQGIHNSNGGLGGLVLPVLLQEAVG